MNVDSPGFPPEHLPALRRALLLGLTAAAASLFLGFAIGWMTRSADAPADSVPQTRILEDRVADLEQQKSAADAEVARLLRQTGGRKEGDGDLRLRVADLEQQKSSLEGELARIQMQAASLGPGASVIWKPLFLDTFQRREIGPSWRIQSGDWRIEDGKLLVSTLLENVAGSMISCTAADFSGDIMVSYSCRTTESYNGQACDMSFGIDIPPGPRAIATQGHFFRFGGMNNTESGLVWGGDGENTETLAANRQVRIVPGKKHMVVLQRLGNRLSMSVDDQPVFAVESRHAPAFDRSGAEGCFYIFRSAVEIDSFLVCKPIPMLGKQDGRGPLRHP